MEGRGEAMAAMRALLDTHRIITEAMEKRLRAEAGLSLAQWEVLYRLDQAPACRLRMVDITRQLCVSKSGVTQLVDRLERAGLVAREFSRSDRRLTFATLTEQGAAALRRSGPVWAPIVQRHFTRHLSVEDVHCVGEALAKVVEGNRDRDAG
ncbi:MAG TPA: MarR family transcriptional regulator [Actinomycetota bacterium]|nr:MarR family transcriptional regulator [Actinomycetota bacterium]